MNKLTHYLFSATLFICFISVSANASEPDVKPGMWEWTMTMEVPGMQFALPPVVYESCVTKKDFVPQQSNPDQECKMLENKVTNNSVQWKIECSSDGSKSLSEGKILYSNTTAKGEIKVTTQGMTMISKLNGRYTGKCK